MCYCTPGIRTPTCPNCPNESQEKYRPKETYLGYGLYVSFDGHSFTLRSPNFAGMGDELILIDQKTMDKLIEYRNQIGDK